jgi:predicted dehydrogenase
VLVEKPLCITREDADRIAERAAETGRVVQVGYMKRFDPGFEALRDALARPAAGAVRHVSTFTVDPGLARAFAPSGFVPATGIPRAAAQHLAVTTAAQVAAAVGSEDPADVAPFSDAFLGALVHDVNAVLGALGDPVAEPRVLDAAAEPGVRLAAGTVELPGGARWTMAWVLAEAAGRFAEELRFVARDGVHALRFGAPYLRQAPAEYAHERADGPLGARRSSTGSYADSYTRELEHFHACVTRGEPCRTPPEQARADIALLTRMYRAVLESRVAA